MTRARKNVIEGAELGTRLRRDRDWRASEGGVLDGIEIHVEETLRRCRQRHGKLNRARQLGLHAGSTKKTTVSLTALHLLNRDTLEAAARKPTEHSKYHEEQVDRKFLRIAPAITGLCRSPRVFLRNALQLTARRAFQSRFGSIPA